MEGRMSVLHGSNDETEFMLGRGDGSSVTHGDLSESHQPEPSWNLFRTGGNSNQVEEDVKPDGFNLWTGMPNDATQINPETGPALSHPADSKSTPEDESTVDVELSMIRRRETLRRRGPRPSSTSPSPPPGPMVDFPFSRQTMAPANGGFWEIDPAGQWRWVIPAMSLPHHPQPQSFPHDMQFSSEQNLCFQYEDGMREQYRSNTPHESGHEATKDLPMPPWLPHLSSRESEMVGEIESQQTGNLGQPSIPAFVAAKGFEWHQTGSEGFVFRNDGRNEKIREHSPEPLRRPRSTFRAVPKALPSPAFTASTNPLRSESASGGSDCVEYKQLRQKTDLPRDSFPESKNQATNGFRNRTKDLEDAMLSELKKPRGLGVTIESGVEGRILYEAQMEWYGRAAERGMSSIADGYSLLSRLAADGLRPTRGMYHGLLHILECQTMRGNASLDDARTALSHMNSANVGMDSETANILLKICIACAQQGQITIHDLEQLILQVYSNTQLSAFVELSFALVMI